MLDSTWILPQGRVPARSFLRSARSGTSGTYFVWTEESSGERRVRLRRISADTLEQDASSIGIGEALGAQQEPDVAADGSGGVFVVWTDFNTGEGDVYALRIGADGEISVGWPREGIAVCNADGQQANPRVVACSDGSAIVAWEDRRSGVLDVFATRLSGEPTPHPSWPTNGVSLTGGLGSARMPGLFSFSSGDIVVTWQRAGGQGGMDLVAAVVGDDAASGVPPSAITLSSGAEMFGEPGILSLSDGSKALGWGEVRQGGGSLQVRRLSATPRLEVTWSGGEGAMTRASVTDAPSLLAATDSTIAVAWQAPRIADESDVFVLMLKGDGSLAPGWPADGVAACVAGGDQFAPELSSDGAGGVVVSWYDSRPVSVGSAVIAMATVGSAVRLLGATTSPGRARIVWQQSGAIDGPVTAHRRIGDTGWAEISAPASGDSGQLVLDDRTAPEGAHVEYRLLLRGTRIHGYTETVALDIPAAPQVLALHRVRSLGRERALLVSFALPRGESPRLDLLDVQGRRMLDERIGGLEPGEQQYRWQLPSRVASGVYFLRLVQGGEVRTRKVLYLR